MAMPTVNLTFFLPCSREAIERRGGGWPAADLPAPAAGGTNAAVPAALRETSARQLSPPAI
jgi:hypothetical protein